MQTAEKPNIFDLELVTVGHPKTAAKLTHKTTKIITQQLNKINIYTE